MPRRANTGSKSDSRYDTSGQETVCLFASAANGWKLKSLPLLASDEAIIDAWVGERRETRSSERSRPFHASGSVRKWWSDTLINLALGVYIGVGNRADTGPQKVILPPSYYTCSVAALRRNGDPSCHDTSQLTKQSTYEAAKIFGKSCALTLPRTRCFWETRLALLPVFLKPDHWMLVAITNGDVLQRLIEGDVCATERRRPRILLAVSLGSTYAGSARLRAVVENVHHWIASMYMLKQGSWEADLGHGLWRWERPVGGGKRFAAARRAVAAHVLCLDLNTPIRRDTDSCGPSTVLSLIYLSRDATDVHNLRDAEDVEAMRLSTIYTAANAMVFATVMKRVIVGLKTNPVVTAATASKEHSGNDMLAALGMSTSRAGLKETY